MSSAASSVSSALFAGPVHPSTSVAGRLVFFVRPRAGADSLWESGADSLGDAGNAIMDGLEEVRDTGAAVGDLAKDAWDAIF